MEVSNIEETASKSPENLGESKNSKSRESAVVDGDVSAAEDDPVLDISGKSLDFPWSESAEDLVRGLFVYRNAFNLIPGSIGQMERLRKLKFFANEINLFPPEFANLVGLESLQVRVSPPGFGELPLHKLKGLRELELSKVPHRPSAFPLLSGIAGLKCLTKLSICHFSLRYLPPEFGCLNKLAYLDLSFNKLKSLPTEISYLNDLISLKVANNKLAELPSALSSLQKLENLDLSNNRLTSLQSLELGSMRNLQNLNLQFNKLPGDIQIPSWMLCNLEGNGENAVDEDITTVAMDVYENTIQENEGNLSCKSSHHSSLSFSAGASSNSRSLAAHRSGKRWRRQYYLQQKARQERLNNSRKWKGVDHTDFTAVTTDENLQGRSLESLPSETCKEGASEIGLDDDKEVHSGEGEGGNFQSTTENDNANSNKELDVENCSSIDVSCTAITERDDEYHESTDSISTRKNGKDELDKGLSLEILKAFVSSKRHSERDLENPKPCKTRKPAEEQSKISQQYSSTSFCGAEDLLPDGFYDAGRDRPFMPIINYEQNWSLDSREVILMDREQDEVLDAITLKAHLLVSHLKKMNSLTRETNRFSNDLHIASLLALFVSDHFGGSDRSGLVERTRKAASGSNYQKPFVCTCSTGNKGSIDSSIKSTVDTVEDNIFSDLCERSLQSIKARRNSVIVPIGTLQFGVCRHRALLLKYLCDRMEPPVPCELVRGYLDFLPHAWNIILVRRAGNWVRMIVDACRPHDVREELDPEYFCRYLPLSQTVIPTSSRSLPDPMSLFPSISSGDEIEKSAASSLIRCKLGSLEVAAKVRTLEVCGTSVDETRKFEYSCLGEVRILGALKHSCIVEKYGHQISTKWIPSENGTKERRLIQTMIFLEYVKGGSLKNYLDKLFEAGEKHVPFDLALCIAKDIACALAEIHSKHIIHRDIKSENILIDLDKKRADGTPVVKLCDFDHAVPLRSTLHTCCIAHVGIPPPDVCVGTPRWMAPEVMQAMDIRRTYGLEVDIWSFGCVLLELLTLRVPYLGSTDSEIHQQIKMGNRPKLTDELEALDSFDDFSISESVVEPGKSEGELETLKLFVDLFRQCTRKNPVDRPTAEKLYNIFLEHEVKLAGFQK